MHWKKKYARKSMIAALATMLFLVLTSTSGHSGLGFIGLPNLLSASAQGLATDGHSFLATGTTSSPKSLSLTTSNANDLIIVYAVSGNSKDHSGFSPVQSVKASGLTFTLRKQYQVVSSASGWHWDLEEWFAIASSPLSADQITVTWLPAPSSYIVLDAFGISGANTTSPFDGNSSLPAPATGGFASLSTSNANDMIYGLEVTDNTAKPTSGSGFAAIDAPGHYFASEYKVVSTVQTSLPVAFTNSNGGASDVEAELADAVSLSTTTTSYPMTVVKTNATTTGVYVTVHSTSNEKYDIDVWVFNVTTHTTGDTGEETFGKVTGYTISSGNTQTIFVPFSSPLSQIPDGTWLFKAQCMKYINSNDPLSAGYSWTQSVSSSSSSLIDGHNYFATSVTSSSESVALTTSKPNDMIIVFASSGNSKDKSFFSSVLSVKASGLSFALREQYQVVSAVSGWHWDLEEWYAIASSPLSGDQITVTWSTGNASYLVVDLFGISGANTTSPFDSNSALPGTNSGGFATVSTHNAHDIIFGLEVTDNTAKPTSGSGFAAIDAPGHYFASEYKVVSTVQTSLPVAFTNSNGGASDVEAELADAVTL